MVRFSIVALVLTLSAAGSARADTGVFPVSGVKLSAVEGETIGALLASAYAEETGAAVHPPCELRDSLQRTASEPDSAVELGLLDYLHTEATRLPDLLSLYVSLRDRSGRELYSVSTSVAYADELPQAARAIAAALAHRRPLASEPRRARRARRAPTQESIDSLIGARFGLGGAVTDPIFQQPNVLAEFDARFEQPDYFLELAGGLWLPTYEKGLTGLVSHIGASYYLLGTNSAPYIGAGISPRFTTRDSRSGAGFAVSAHVGMTFLRRSASHFYTELQVDQNLVPVGNVRLWDSAAQTNKTPTSLPTEVMFAMGMGF